MNALKAYDMELLKQAEPYQYYLKNSKHEERGESINVEGPLPCVINIHEIDTSLYECTAFAKSLLSEADVISYVMLKTSKVSVSQGDILQMLKAGLDPIPSKNCNSWVNSDEKSEKLYPDLIYFDNDYIRDDGIRHTPFFKPDYSPHSLLGSNYMGECVAVRKEVILDVLADDKESVWSRAITEYNKINKDNKDSESLVIWALLIDITKRCNSITHVTNYQYHMLSNGASEDIYSEYADTFNTPFATFIREYAMKISGINEKKDYSLSIIIPSKDNSDLIAKCIDSIKIKTRFNEISNPEIIIIDNGSCAEERKDIERYISANQSIQNDQNNRSDDCPEIKYIYEPAEFNYAAMCNKAAECSKGDLLLFMNDDIEAVTDDFIDKMARFALLDEVGAVGPKLLYPDGVSIQHTGITSLDCGPTHKLATFNDSKVYYFGYNRFIRNSLAVTGACLMIGREKYFQVNGFHDKMKVSYNDVDLCVNLYEKGLFNVVLNDVVLLHHESLTRGSDLASEEKYLRLKKERDLFYERHPWLYEGYDPFYNDNLIKDTLDYRPDIMPDYEIRDRICPVEVLSCKRISGVLHKAFRDRLKFNVESTKEIPSFLDPKLHFVEIEGWSHFLRHDNRLYDRYFLLVPCGDEENPAENDFAGRCNRAIKVRMMPKLRQDVGDVFKDEKYTDLAGFVIRIPKALLKEDTKYRIGIMYEHKVFHIKSVAFGEIYELGKGYGE